MEGRDFSEIYEKERRRFKLPAKNFLFWKFFAHYGALFGVKKLVIGVSEKVLALRFYNNELEHWNKISKVRIIGQNFWLLRSLANITN